MRRGARCAGARQGDGAAASTAAREKAAAAAHDVAKRSGASDAAAKVAAAAAGAVRLYCSAEQAAAAARAATDSFDAACAVLHQLQALGTPMTAENIVSALKESGMSVAHMVATMLVMRFDLKHDVQVALQKAGVSSAEIERALRFETSEAR